jgi:chromosome segregation ATPase
LKVLQLENERLRREQASERERTSQFEEQRRTMQTELAAIRGLLATLHQEFDRREKDATTFREVATTLRRQLEVLEAELREHRRSLRSRAVGIARKVLWKK